MRMCKRPEGFWLSEVLTSLWLVTFIGAALLGLFVYLSKASKISNERAAAELLADKLLERAARRGPPDWGMESGQVGTLLQSDEGHENMKLTYRVDPSELENHRLGILYLVEVTVNWSPRPGAGGSERGQGTLTRSRQVYIEDTAEIPEPEV
jgi:hypothetical protein